MLHSIIAGLHGISTRTNYQDHLLFVI